MTFVIKKINTYVKICVGNLQDVYSAYDKAE